MCLTTLRSWAMKISANSDTTKKASGNASIHGVPLRIWSAPPLISAPHKVEGSCTPRPRTLMKLSKMIMSGTSSVA